MSEDHTIVCLSSQSWDDGMWTNKQHVMSRMARDHRVVHVDHGLHPLPLYLYKRLKEQPSDLLRPWQLLTEGVVHREDNLYIGDAWGPALGHLLPHSNAFRDFWTYDFKVELVRRSLERQGIDDPILWVYHPGFGDAVDKLPSKLVVYDCVDNYPAFPFYDGDRQWLIEREERLARNADIVFGTSPEIVDKLEPYNPDHTHLAHNVGDADHFKTALDPGLAVPEELRELEGPVVGFIGAVSNYKLNASWLIETAQRRPDWNIVIIGPVGRGETGTDIDALEGPDNISLLGYRDYERLPAYLKGFDVATIPYNINDYTRSVFPIKFFEYFATGTPVVTSNLPALEDYYELPEVAETVDEFVAGCERALKDNAPEAIEARVALAEDNSWDSKVNDMMALVEERLDGLGR